MVLAGPRKVASNVSLHVPHDTLADMASRILQVGERGSSTCNEADCKLVLSETHVLGSFLAAIPLHQCGEQARGTSRSDKSAVTS
jgi:hypothetical protein